MTKHFPLKVGAPMPKTLGRCADEYKYVNQLRLDREKDVAKIKARENEYKEHLIENISVSEDKSHGGQFYKARVITKVKPTAEDWDEIWDYVSENDRFDILSKGLNGKAIQELWDDDQKIPGVGRINTKTLRVTKI